MNLWKDPSHFKRQKKKESYEVLSQMYANYMSGLHYYGAYMIPPHVLNPTVFNISCFKLPGFFFVVPSLPVPHKSRESNFDYLF